MKFFNLNAINIIVSTILVFSNLAEARKKPTAAASKIKATQLPGFLSDVAGDVLLDGTPAKNGDLLKVGSKISTGAEGRVNAVLGSGTVSVIGYNSAVVLEKNEIDTNKIETILFALKKGNLRYLVSDKGTAKLAMVRAGDAIGSTRGGEALFSCNGDCTDKLPVKNNLKKGK